MQAAQVKSWRNKLFEVFNRKVTYQGIMVNRKSYTIIFYIVCTLFFIACNEKAQLNPHSSFRLENLTDSYNSNTATFTRRYNSDTIKVKIRLTKDEKMRILESFSENNFQGFPNEIDCSKWGVSPEIYDELTLNNRTVKYIHNTDQGLFCLKGKRFNNISTLINNILMDKPEVKKLEVSNIGYE